MAQVLIVGAGPAGASLAYLLASRGIQVTLLERQREFAREFRGEILMPSGIDVIRQMGLSAAFAAVPRHELGHIDVYLNRRTVFRADLPPDETVPTAVSQPGLLEMLVAESAKHPGFRLERGASFSGLLVENERVVGVRAKTDDGVVELRADLVIGADGRGSKVRKAAGLAARDLDVPMDIVWCKLPCPENWSGARFYAGGGNLLAAYETYDGTLQMGWVIVKGTFGELRSRGIEGWVEQMAHHVDPDFAAHLRAHTESAEHTFLLSTRADCVETWSAPGVLVMGDAAHTMSPVGGQGVNIALRDALVAANGLVPVLSEPRLDPAAVDRALRQIETERMREVAPLQRIQSMPPRVLLTHAWWGGPLRWTIAAVVGNRLIQSLAGRRLAGPANAFFNGWTEVKLSV